MRKFSWKLIQPSGSWNALKCSSRTQYQRRTDACSMQYTLDMSSRVSLPQNQLCKTNFPLEARFEKETNIWRKIKHLCKKSKRRAHLLLHPLSTTLYYCNNFSCPSLSLMVISGNSEIPSVDSCTIDKWLQQENAAVKILLLEDLYFWFIGKECAYQNKNTRLNVKYNKEELLKNFYRSSAS